jgi:hypothetical protein
MVFVRNFPGTHVDRKFCKLLRSGFVNASSRLLPGRRFVAASELTGQKLISWKAYY